MARITMTVPNLQDINQLAGGRLADPNLDYVSKHDKYEWIVQTLNTCRYRSLSKKDKGKVLQFMCTVTGHNKPYVYQMITKYLHYQLKAKKYSRSQVYRKYTSKDIRLLAATDIDHKRLSSAATKKIIQREYEVYGKVEYQNLSGISISHINNLRKRPRYSCTYTNGTKAQEVSIGCTMKPEPNGKPGSIRVDTVHQRDVYYINSICEILQWEQVFCVPAISEIFLQPILELMLETFPFKVFNFHSDRDSEYINDPTSKLLNKLLVNQTKSRSRHCNDNALIECKNGAIIRKHMGYGYLAEELAPSINQFCIDYLNIYLNFHRPCGYLTEKKRSLSSKRSYYVYGNYDTPYQRLKHMKDSETFLREGVTFKELDKIEMAHSDNEFARLMRHEKEKLYREINKNKEQKLPVPDSNLLKIFDE